MSGAIIFQTFCGALLSLGHRREGAPEDEQDEDASWVLTLHAVAALVQVAVVAKWWHTIRRRAADTAEAEGTAAGTRLSLEGIASEAEGEEDEVRRGLLSDATPIATARLSGLETGAGAEETSWKKAQGLRWGRRALILAGATVVFSWLCFLANLLV